jgi:hypothetical protein
MLGESETPWQSQLMIREVLNPTRACRVIVEEHFHPELQQLMEILQALVPQATATHKVRQIAFSVIGQCLFYRVARTVVRMLVPEPEHERHYTIERLTDHIHATMIASIKHGPPGPEVSNHGRSR